jgi:hypothetical protein
MAPMTIRDNRDIWDSPYKDSVPLVPWALPLHGGTNVPDCPDCPGCPLGHLPPPSGFAFKSIAIIS